MNTKGNPWVKHIDFLILDLICVEVSYLISYYLRHGLLDLNKYSDVYVTMAFLLPIMDLLYAIMTNVHHDILKRGIFHELQNIVVNTLIVWGLATAAIYYTKAISLFSRAVSLEGIVLCIALMCIARYSYKAFLKKKYKDAGQLPNLLLVTTADRAGEILANFQTQQFTGYHLLGLAIVDRDSREGSGRYEGVCYRDTLESYLIGNVVDDVMISLPSGFEKKAELIRTIVQAGPIVHINMEFGYNDLPNRYVEDLNGYAVLTSSISKPSGFQLLIKRLMDIVGALVGLLICGVSVIIVGPLIKKASPGPIFFVQERVGKNGRHFKMYKLRSMYLDAEERKKELMKQLGYTDMMFKMENDPRIIGSEKGPGKGIGNFIRKTSIDELPQFWNVLKGDMSLVGTRPPTLDEVEQYSLHHKVRLSMKPGITGLWQVSGRSDIKDFEEVVRLDEEYIANWSLALDIKLLFKTVSVVLHEDGAK